MTGLFRYATVAICPDMAEPVKQEWNNRMQRRGMGEPYWDALWTPKTTPMPCPAHGCYPTGLMPAPPLTTLPQQTVPGGPMVPVPPTNECPPGHPTGPGWEEC